MKKLSIIVPCYNEQEALPLFLEEIQCVAEKMTNTFGVSFEFLFVNDGSKDGTLDLLRTFAGQDERVRYISFSRNFGKEAAMFAGLEKVTGDCAVILDCDLQHPPEKIPEMYQFWEQGYEVVEGIKQDRGSETKLHSFAANSFYRIISGATGMDMANASDFKLLDRKVIDALNQMPEKKVFFRALSYWVGFRKAEVNYQVQERVGGESKWSTKSLIKYAITNVTAFSSVPLQIVSILGIVMLIVTVILGATVIVQKVMGIALGGFTAVILLILFSGSIIMISMGIIGYYIAKIYDEVKGRPRYIIAEENVGNER